MTPLHITALRHSAFYGPLLATIAGGYLEREGVRPVYRPLRPGESLADALTSGVYQVAQSAISVSWMAAQRGDDPELVHFAQINSRDGFFLVGRALEPDFKWSRLHGARVLVDHFFQPLAMFKYAMHRAGADYAQIQSLDVGDVAAMERAFRDGEGDYAHLQGPAPQQIEHEGLGYVVAAVGEAVGPVAFSSLCATRAWLTDETAKPFMRAYRAGCRYVTSAPAAEIAASLADFFPGIDRDVLAATIGAYQSLGCWSEDPAIPRTHYEAALEVFRHSGVLSRRYAYDDFVATPPGAR